MAHFSRRESYQSFHSEGIPPRSHLGYKAAVGHVPQGGRAINGVDWGIDWGKVTEVFGMTEFGGTGVSVYRGAATGLPGRYLPGGCHRGRCRRSGGAEDFVDEVG